MDEWRQFFIIEIKNKYICLISHRSLQSQRLYELGTVGWFMWCRYEYVGAVEKTSHHLLTNWEALSDKRSSKRQCIGRELSLQDLTSMSHSPLMTSCRLTSCSVRFLRTSSGTVVFQSGGESRSASVSLSQGGAPPLWGASPAPRPLTASNELLGLSKLLKHQTQYVINSQFTLIY